ncbi:MAG: bifunctional oligoribonuclease/PAP phosphatase NrnA [Chloroflexi bacterium]|nr:bifunctional oligoribonuclease/PAP phosphatase NrnA [Chloroflexota bacterium]
MQYNPPLPGPAVPIIEALKKNRSFIIAPHENIDGDALGSTLALFLTLDKMGKEVYAYSADGVPELFMFLNGIEKIKNAPPPSPAQVAVLLECSYPDRISGGYPPERLGSFTVNIDHHPINGDYTDLSWVDHEMSSCCEMAYYIVRELGGLDADTASALFVGIMTDTGALQFSNVNSHTHIVLAHLLQFGIQGSEIIKKVYRERPIAYLRLFGRVADTLQRLDDGSVAWADLDCAMLDECGIEQKELQTLTEDLNRIKDTDIFVLFKALDEGKIRVSLRSNETRVDNIARKFGGGGHTQAAAFDFKGTLEEAHSAVLSEIRNAKKQPGLIKQEAR